GAARNRAAVPAISRIARGRRFPRSCGKHKPRPCGPGLAVCVAGLLAVELLLELAALLRLDGERGGGPREQALDADRLAGLLAESVAAVLDARERRVDLLQELPLAVARAKLERVLLLERGAVGRIGGEGKLAQVLGGGTRVLAELALQLEEPLAEEFELRRVHVFRLRHLDDFRLGQGLHFAGHCSSQAEPGSIGPGKRPGSRRKPTSLAHSGVDDQTMDNGPRDSFRGAVGCAKRRPPARRYGCDGAKVEGREPAAGASDAAAAACQ